MKSEEEIKKLKSEIYSWLGTIFSHPALADPTVVVLLVCIHDSLGLVLGEPPSSLTPYNLNSILAQTRDGIKAIKEKEEKHRTTLLN